tara:strand:+ start:451 stop:1410 length:960 start_codon:yes stop_codon:yes gene_type:complete
MKGRSLHKGTKGHKSALKQITEKEWSTKTNTGTKGIPEDGGKGMEFLKADLKSKGYEKRLANELEAAGGGDYIKRAPNKKELKKDPDRSLVKIKNPTSQNVMDVRTNRSENIMFNDPSKYDKEGNYIGYAHADYIKRGEGSDPNNNTNRLMPSSNVYFSDNFNWKEGQKNRIEGGDLITHEGAHAITAGEHGMLENTKNLLTNAKGGDASKGNINKPQEVYARYKVTQKYLKNQGLFDAFTGDKFTDKNVKQVEKLMEGVTAENYKQKGIPYEVFTFFGDNKNMKGHGFNKKMSKKDMKDIFNNVASNESDLEQTQTFA